MKRAILPFLLLLFSVTTAAGQEPLALDSIFAGDRYREDLLLDVLWLPDSSAFLYRRQAGPLDGLWLQEAKGGRERLVADWNALQKGLAAARPTYRAPDPDNVNSHPGAGMEATLSPDGRFYLASSRGDLFLLDLASGRARFLTAAPGLERFATFSPDGSQVAFTRDGDLYTVAVATGRERRLTSRGKSSWLLNGEADWVYEEELGVDRSFWWSPRSERILFLQFDTSPIVPFPIPDYLGGASEIEWQRYPRAGAANSRVRLQLLDLQTGDLRILFDAGASDSYLPRAGWWPDGTAAWYVTLNRDQNRLELRTVIPGSGTSRVIVTEEDPAWVNVPAAPVFPDSQRFVWASERDGFRHLHLYRRDGTLLRPLTSGSWVVDEVLGTSANGERLLFRGNAEDPRESHIYSVSLEGGRPAARLDGAPGWHEAQASPDGRYLVDTHSELNRPGQVDLIAVGEGVRRTICGGPIPGLAAVRLAVPELGSLESEDGTPLYWSMLRPPDFDPARKYPVLVYVYGGPGTQLVTNQWPGSAGLFRQALAQRGLIVFTLDNRGSARRGCAFEKAVYRRLGQLELADQLRGVQFLKSLPYVDPERIGVYGGSYGGYMALLCMNRAPEHFRAGVAYAPVTDWALYDSVYTERFMDRPEDNPEGYREGAPLRFAGGLSGPVLICHGSADNNVHLQNSLRMADEYMKAGKLFEMMVYPGIRHGIRMSKYRLHFHTLKTEFLERHLIRGGPR